MAVSFVEGSSGGGASSCTVTPLGNSQSRDISFLSVMAKGYNTTIDRPAGWKVLSGQVNNGSVASGLDTGSVTMAVFYRTGYIGNSAISITTSGTPSNTVTATVVTWRKANSEEWSFGFATGGDTTDGANFSALSNTISIATGQFVMAFVALNSDAGAVSASTITHTVGTLGSWTLNQDATNVNGDDSRQIFGYATVTSGGSGSLGYTHTNASSASGQVVWVRLTADSLASRNWIENVGAVVTGSGSGPLLQPVSPSSGAGYRNYLVNTWKASDVSPPVITTTGTTWKFLQRSTQSALVATGADVGSMVTELYYCEDTAPTATNVQFVGTVGSAQSVIFNVNKSASRITIHSTETGEDSSYGADYTALSPNNMNKVGSNFGLMVAISGTNSDAGTIDPNVTAGGISGFYPTNFNVVDSASATGDDSRLNISYFRAISGTESAGPQVTWTNASSSQGTTVFLWVEAVVTPTITATPTDDFYKTAGYDITVAGLTGFTYTRLYRGDLTGGAQVELRGGQYEAVSSSTRAMTDYEFYFGSSGLISSSNIVTWYADIYYNGEITYTATTTKTPINDWNTSVTTEALQPAAAVVSTFLSNPSIPALNEACLIQDFKAYTRGGNVLSKSHVLGRARPVVTTDVTSGREGTFSILVPESTYSGGFGAAQVVSEYMTLLETGDVLMLRNIQPYAAGFDDFYFIVEGITTSRQNRVINPHAPMAPIMVIEVTWTEVDAPPNTGAVSQFTWQTLLDHFNSWQQVLNTFSSWLQVLQVTDGDFS